MYRGHCDIYICAYDISNIYYSTSVPNSHHQLLRTASCSSIKTSKQGFVPSNRVSLASGKRKALALRSMRVGEHEERCEKTFRKILIRDASQSGGKESDSNQGWTFFLFRHLALSLSEHPVLSSVPSPSSGYNSSRGEDGSPGFDLPCPPTHTSSDLSLTSILCTAATLHREITTLVYTHQSSGSYQYHRKLPQLSNKFQVSVAFTITEVFVTQKVHENSQNTAYKFWIRSTNPNNLLQIPNLSSM